MIDALAPLLDAGQDQGLLVRHRRRAGAGRRARARRGTACGCRTSSTSTCATRSCRRSARTARSPDIEIWAAGASIGAFHAVAVRLPLPRRVRARARDERAPTTCARFYRDATSSPTTSSSRRRCTSCRRSRAGTSTCCARASSSSPRARAAPRTSASRGAMANVLGKQGIPNRVDSWGPEWHHDWPTWRAMLPQVPRTSGREARRDDDHAIAQGRRRPGSTASSGASSCARSSPTCARSSACSPRGMFETGVAPHRRRAGDVPDRPQLAPGARRRCRCSSSSNDPHYTTELGQFQLEINADPQLFTGDGLSRDADAARRAGRPSARKAAAELGIDVGADGHPADHAQDRPRPRQHGAEPALPARSTRSMTDAARRRRSSSRSRASTS